MPTEPTLVIGGGLIGLATAHALLERGEPVRLLEAREGVALETSFANGGMLTPSMAEPWNGPGVHRHLAASLLRPSPSMQLRFRALPSLAAWGVRFLRNSTPERFAAATTDNYRLAVHSRELTLALTSSLQLDFDLRDTGTLAVFTDEEDFAERRSICELLAPLGMGVEYLDAAGVCNIEPALAAVADRFVGGIWLPGDSMGDAHGFCLALAERLERDGARIEPGAKVDGILVERGAVRGVSTGAGRIDASRVVVAAGASAPHLLKSHGIPLPVRPAKGYSLTYDCGGLGDLPSVAIVDESCHAVVSRFGERMRIVGTAEFAGFDKSIAPFRIDHLHGVLEGLLPRIAAAVDRGAGLEWTGLRPMSADGRPLIGWTGVEGLFVNGGHGALGWTMAMGSADVLADLLTGREPAVDHRPFLPQRR